MIHRVVDYDISPRPRSKQKRTPRKHWIKSRTLWVNAIAGLLLTAEASLHIIQPLIGDNTYMLASFGLILINVLMRTLTTVALGADDATG